MIVHQITEQYSCLFSFLLLHCIHLACEIDTDLIMSKVQGIFGTYNMKCWF